MAEAHGKVWVGASGSQSHVVHTRLDCPTLKHTEKIRKVDRQVYPNRDVCQTCLYGTYKGGPYRPRNGQSDGQDTCGTCGGSLSAEDHSACICPALDRLHDIPRDAEYCPVGGYP